METSDQGRWTISQATLDDRPIFIRLREDLRDDPVKQADYPFQIGVAVPLRNPTQDGLTTDAEASELHKVEDQLDGALSENQEAIHVMILTFNGIREFVLYAKEWKPESF